jgi:hypothetical protein
MAFSKLPLDLIPSILEYRQLPNYKTCRVQEADLIREAMQLVREAVSGCEMSEWTLFGARYILRWIVEGGMENYGRPPRIRPPREYEDYTKWYTQTFMCIWQGI